MRFIPHIALVLTAGLMAFGCQAATVTGPGWGEIPEGPGGGLPGGDDPIEDGADPEQVFLEQVLPVLDASCSNCHSDAGPNLVFIPGGDPYSGLLDSGLVAIGDPGTSLLLTKGAHTGPAFDEAETNLISAWIELEAGIAPGGDPGIVDPGGAGGGGAGGGGEEDPPPVVGDYETAPQAIVDGDNVIDLDDAGLPGAELRFFAQRVALGLHISSVTVYTGASGVAFSHPTLITNEPGGASTPDPEDRFATTELVVTADAAALLSENVLLVDFPVDGELSISFVSASTL